MTALSIITLQATSSSVIFSNIPSTYRDLVLVTDIPSSENGHALTFNNDGSNYASIIMYAYSGGPGSYTDTVIRGTTSSTIPRQFIYTIMDYSATNKNKSVLFSGAEGSASVQAAAARWASTAQITSLKLEKTPSGVFPVGSTFSLYGRIA